MAAHALTITQQLLQLSLRADDGTLAHRLDEALSFAPGYDLGGGLPTERWSHLYALAHAEREEGWREALVQALWGAYREAAWLDPFPTLEEVRRAAGAARVEVRGPADVLSLLNKICV